MTKRTPDQEMAHQMQKMKDMGVTISVQLAPGRASVNGRPAQVIAEAARAAGIYEGSGEAHAPALTADQLAEVLRFGIHPELGEGS